ncbi:flagella basal body P-ring formation protein FlgA [Rhizobium skierniewicense]|uniref:Flagella basal body P-ring formation protein FlgA n=1 Tax=Rhizobium skierniewicense TaxID=984260 RepID=A0A7W6C5J7_9HYPH|nr:flagellar basal body P-ring formation chaperone FlgA [Rhizobium skierniewicense]MBB3944844.1 flagella basal body P-ring formation protein FlgA [Rhizobium skierniewicense]
MKFRPKIVPGSFCTMALALMASLVVFSPQAAFSQQKYAVVPTGTIFPGETITRERVTEVLVTNPNLAPGYADNTSIVVGKVSKRTLVAGRTITVADLRDPFAVQRGAAIRITYSMGGMNLSASGTAIEDAMAGEVVRVRNRDTGVTISGTAMENGTVEVFEK